MPKQQWKSRKTTKFINFQQKKRNEIRASLPQLSNNPDHGHEVKLLIRILYLSAEAQVFRKSQHLSLLHYFYCFNTLVP